nr:hypothetical protein Iba_chr11bCG13660 [Ipomoea batatas]
MSKLSFAFEVYSLSRLRSDVVFSSRGGILFTLRSPRNDGRRWGPLWGETKGSIVQGLCARLPSLGCCNLCCSISKCQFVVVMVIGLRSSDVIRGLPKLC